MLLPLQLGLGLLFIPPIVGGITLILKNTGPFVGLYLYFFLLFLGLFMLTIYPVAIAPLFNKFTPLPEGPLRSVQDFLFCFFADETCQCARVPKCMQCFMTLHTYYCTYSHAQARNQQNNVDENSSCEFVMNATWSECICCEC